MVTCLTAILDKNMNHKRIQNELSAYIDNELSPDRQKQIEAHLRSCDVCAKMLSAFQKNRQMVANLSRPVPLSLKDAVMAKIHTEFQDELSAYIDNELAPVMRARMETHLHACSECSDMVSAFRENRERVRHIERPAPASIKDAVMAKIHEQAAEADIEKSTRAPLFRDIGKWVPDLGRWFFRPVTAGATAVLTLALILGALYFQPNTPEYDETLDFYFGLHTEQLTDNPLKSNVGRSLGEESLSIESIGETEELFLDLYLENVEP